MNQFIGKVIELSNVNNLNLITFSIKEREVIFLLSLELEPPPKIGELMILGVKATHLSITNAKELTGALSFDNRLRAKIVSIEDGEILSSLCLEIEGFLCESIITMRSKERMNLKIEDEVVVLINSADISIVKRSLDARES